MDRWVFAVRGESMPWIWKGSLVEKKVVWHQGGCTVEHEENDVAFEPRRDDAPGAVTLTPLKCHDAFEPEEGEIQTTEREIGPPRRFVLRAGR